MARRIAIVAGLVGGAGWITKVLVMSAQGGPDPNSASEAIAFFVGLFGVAIATAAVGIHIEHARPAWRRVLAAIVGIVGLVLVIGLAQVALPALFGDGWVPEEAIFGAIGFFAIIAALFFLRRPPTARVPGDAIPVS